jgi:hypothetical protein
VKTIRRIFPLLAFLLLCSPASRATNFQTLLPRPPRKAVPHLLNYQKNHYYQKDHYYEET